jgi:VanZ family protein
VVVGSILPSSILGRLHYGALAANDKLVHLSAYTMLGFLAVINLSRLDAGLRAALFTLAMGTALEYIQLRIPGRSCEVGDMVANATGVLLGVTLAGACRACYRRMAAESVQ